MKERGHWRRAKTVAGAERSMVPENTEREEVEMTFAVRFLWLHAAAAGLNYCSEFDAISRVFQNCQF